MAEPNLSELVTTTLRNRQPRLQEQIRRQNALLTRLSSSNRVQPVGGGREIVQPLLYAESNGFMWYDGAELLDTTPSQVVDAATYDWKQAAVPISITGKEEMMNASKEQVIDMMAARIESAEITMSNRISSGLYGDGTADGGKSLTGLGAQVSKAPGGVVGGIDQTTYTWWANQTLDFSAVSLTPGTAGHMLSGMKKLWLKLVRGNDKPDLILMDNTHFELYWDELTEMQRIGDSDVGRAGFQTLKFVTADVVLEGGTLGTTGFPSATSYFLNSRYLHFRPHRQRNMVTTDTRIPIQQDALLRYILFMGNLTSSGLQFQGVLFD